MIDYIYETCAELYKETMVSLLTATITFITDQCYYYFSFVKPTSSRITNNHEMVDNRLRTCIKHQ
jgi:hypothetical protein